MNPILMLVVGIVIGLVVGWLIRGAKTAAPDTRIESELRGWRKGVCRVAAPAHPV